MKKTYTCQILILILLTISINIFADELKVTFKVIPDSLPPESNIYITGNHPQIGEWDPNDVELEEQTDGSWIRSFLFETGTYLEYKITRGSWLNEMVDSIGLEYPNFVLDVKKDTTVIIKIPHWRDTYQGITILSLERIQNKAGTIELFENWKYHPGDDPNWAKPEYDDSHWKKVDPRLPQNEYKQIGWTGIGWFRMHFKVDTSLWDTPLSLMIRQAGASEVYLNGKLLYQFGTVGNSESTEVIYSERNPKYILFDRLTNQVLAIRYSNFSADYIHSLNGNPGFDVFLIDLNQHIEGRTGSIRILSNYQMIFTAVPLVLAFLHLMLYSFNLRSRENLYYSICMIGFSALSYGNFQTSFTTNVNQVIFYNNVVLVAINIAILFGLLTVYESTYDRIPKQFILFLIGTMVFFGFVIVHPIIDLFIYFNIYMVIAALEIIRVIIKSSIKNRGEEWLIGIGFIVLIISITYQILIDVDLIEPLGGNRIVYVYGLLALSIAVSINLARDYSKMHKKISAHEQAAREQEIAKRILEADNARKTQELEEARQLQLSLLPKDVPKLDYLDIAVLMRTATEVGGDYYDFHCGEDGTLTIVIGDATGHGMKAGNMVISIKSLFNSLPADMEIPNFFNRCTSIIKRMNMKQLYMCLSIIRILDHKVIVSSAGMPPILLYEKKSKDLKEILLKGMPLGAVDEFPYQQIEIEVSGGDTLLLMTDGFPDLFNESNEILDYTRAGLHFKEIADSSPDKIISHLNKAADQWRGNNPLNDDMTFIVIKFKEI